MADSDKNIVITPNIGDTNYPNITFTGKNNNPVTLNVYDSGELSIEGSSGQLFSITDNLTGTIFSVNDISGIPSIEVDADGVIRLGEFSGNILIGTDSDDSTGKLQVFGNITVTGTVDGRDIAGDGTKLDGIETGATADQTAAEILTAIKTVDGASSGLDADLLDGQQGSYYLDWTNVTNKPDPTVTLTGAVTGSGTMTNLGNVSITTTATADPTLTINGDASGSATFTNLGNATLTLTIADDSHNHIISNVDGLQTALNNKLETSLKGAANGLAELDATGKVPSTQLPSYVDDVLEYANEAGFPGTGETGKIYVALDTNDVYRWSGSAYVKISDAVSSADQATKLATARTIALSGDVTGSTSFDGSANVTIAATIAANSVALGTDTTGNYMVNVSAGSGIAVSHTQGEGSTATVSHSDTSSQASVNNSNGTVIQDVTLDGFGHVTGLASVNLDGRYYTETEADSRFVNVTGDTMTGDLIISKADAKIRLYDATGTTGNNPFIEWDTTANQGIKMELNVYDGELPEAGYGLVVGPSTTNAQWPGTGNLSFSVLGEIYTGSESLSTVNKVFHDGYHPNADKWTTARTLSLTGAVTGSASIDGSGNVSLATTATSDPTITLTGAVTGSGTMTNLGNVSITTTATADPTLTLAGDITGSATFTNLGNATLTANIAANVVGANELNVTGNGTTAQYLRSDGDGTFTWATPPDTNTTSLPVENSGGAVQFTATDTTGIQFAGSGATSVSFDGANQRVTISSTDTNTTYSAGNGISLSGTTFSVAAGGGLTQNASGLSHSDTSAQASVNNSNGTVIQDITLDTYGHITALGSVDLDARYVNKTGDTVSGTITIAEGGSIIYDNTADAGGGGYIPRPAGGSFKTTASTQTGAIQIRFPSGTAPSDMLSFNVDVFDYAGATEGESFTAYVYGYNRGPSASWINSGATIVSDRTDRDFNVRFGRDGTYTYVWIGETNSSWSYAQVILRDFQAGYTANITQFANGWDISFVTSFATVDITSSNNYPVSKQLEVARNIALTGAVTGNANFDGSGNISIATTATSDPTLTLSGDASGSATFTNLGNATLSVTVADNSHNHTIANVTGLQTALDGKLSTTGKAADAELLDGINSTSFLRSDATDTFTNLSGTSLTLGSGVTLQESTDRADLLQITSNTSGWGGIQIRNSSNEGRWSFMTDGTTGGIYDDENNDWHIYMTENAGVGLYYNGSGKLLTTSTGITVTGAVTASNGFVGNASTATTWATGRTISLTGDVTGTSGAFNGSSNLSFSTNIAANVVGANELNVSGNGTSGQLLASDGDGSFSWTDPSSGISFTKKTTTYTASSNEGIIADTTSGAWTLTLPASPATGDQVIVADGGSWATNNLTIGRNSNTIEGVADNYLLDVAGAQVQFIYDGTTWQVYSNPGVINSTDSLTIYNSAGTALKTIYSA